MSLLKTEAVTQVSCEPIKEEISQRSCVPYVATKNRLICIDRSSTTRRSSLKTGLNGVRELGKDCYATGRKI